MPWNNAAKFRSAGSRSGEKPKQRMPSAGERLRVGAAGQHVGNRSGARRPRPAARPPSRRRAAPSNVVSSGGWCWTYSISMSGRRQRAAARSRNASSRPGQRTAVDGRGRLRGDHVVLVPGGQAGSGSRCCGWSRRSGWRSGRASRSRVRDRSGPGRCRGSPRSARGTSRTVGVTWTGNGARPTRATASASAVTALSSLIIEPWPGRPFALQAQPVDALLGRLDQVQPQVVADRVREAADLADRLGAALEQLRMVVDEEVRAVDAARLLVGGEARARCRAADVRRVRRQSRTTASIIASKSFMSIAPRPQR